MRTAPITRILEPKFENGPLNHTQCYEAGRRDLKLAMDQTNHLIQSGTIDMAQAQQSLTLCLSTLWAGRIKHGQIGPIAEQSTGLALLESKLALQRARISIDVCFPYVIDGDGVTWYDTSVNLDRQHEDEATDALLYLTSRDLIERHPQQTSSLRIKDDPL